MCKNKYNLYYCNKIYKFTLFNPVLTKKKCGHLKRWDDHPYNSFERIEGYQITLLTDFFIARIEQDQESLTISTKQFFWKHQPNLILVGFEIQILRKKCTVRSIINKTFSLEDRLLLEICKHWDLDSYGSGVSVIKNPVTSEIPCNPY